MQHIPFKIVFFFMFFQFSSGFAQSEEQEMMNLEKYWNYRDRLTNYFVKAGSAIGESVVAYARNLNRQDKKGFTVGDQTIDLAWYIGILATEYQLLTQNQQNSSATLKELYYALLAFDRLDRCETSPPWNLKKDTLDGFFHRYDTELERDPQLFSVMGRNEDLSSRDVWGTRPPGVPTFISGYDNGWGEPNYYNASASQDQVMHLFMGFSLVYKCLPDSNLTFYDNHIRRIAFNFNRKAKEDIDRILGSFLKSNHWILKDPLGENVERGQNALMYAFPLAIIGQKINGQYYDDYWSQSYFAKKMWDLSRVPNWVNDYNSSMALILAALTDSWVDYTPFGKINNTGFYIAKCGQPWNRETFYLLLYQFINSKTTKWYDKEKVQNQLNIAPFNGPYFWSQDSVEFKCCGLQAGKPQGGWAYPNKFRGTKKEQEGQGRHPIIGNFSGIDYLLLYNLYQLKEQTVKYKRN